MDFGFSHIVDRVRDAISPLKRKYSGAEDGLFHRSGCDLEGLIQSTRAEGLLNLKQSEQYYADGGLFSASIMVEELASLDVPLGYLAMNDYLCGRVCRSTPEASAVDWFAAECGQNADAVWSLSLPLRNEQFCIVGPQNQSPYTITLTRKAIICGKIADSLAGSPAEAVAHQPLSGLDGLSARMVSRDFLLNGPACVRWYCDEDLQTLMVRTLEAERNILLCSIAVGALRAALDYVLDYTRQRKTFGKPICQHQAVMLRLADIGTALETSQLTVAAAAARDPQSLPAVARDTRLYCWDTVWNALLQAAQLLGGHGYLELHPTQKWLRDLECLQALHFPGVRECSL